LLTLAAYSNIWHAPFVFDDVPSIVENATIRHLWPLWDVLMPNQAGGITTSGRPLVNLSLALNYAISGGHVWSYHLVNVAIHLATGMCLLGIIRRTLVLSPLNPHEEGAALPIATAIAAIWLLHPLQTESVAYVVQRAESLSALFYLLTLYCFIRGAGMQEGKWRVASVVACALGMASKEVMVSAPVIVLLYDRAFVSGTLHAAWQRRRGYYLALAATWLIVGALILSTGNRGGTAGFATEISPWTYALTQTRAIIGYIARTFWPYPLIFDHGLATVRHFADVFWLALAVIALLTLTVVMLIRRPHVGFAGACFFALLGPSSSFVPVITQTVAEHRAYLASGVIITLSAIVLCAMLGRRALGVGAAAALAFAVATLARNRDYRSETALWADTVAKLPTNARAHNNLGQALYRRGKIPEAMAAYERALQLQPKYPETHYNLGVALAAQGRTAEAIRHYETALHVQPYYPEALNNMGNALVVLGRVDEAIRYYEEALAVKPDFAEAHNNLGNALLQASHASDAVMRFNRALALRPDYPEARYNLGNALAAQGNMSGALEQYRAALASKPDYAEAHVNAGNALLALARPTEALGHYEKAVALAPRLADAHFNLGSVLLQLERWREAVGPLEAAVRLKPDFANAQRALGYALAKSGRAAEAIAHYEAYLRAMPGDAETREELADIRAGRLR
jgi:tetratricopeptide (TPR) repeat protein